MKYLDGSSTTGATGGDSPIWPQVAQAAGGLFSGIANIFTGKKRAEEAYQRQRTLIDEERDYNDPSAQMERYRKAGINPMMALSKSSSMQNTVSSSGKGVAMAPQPNINFGQATRDALLLGEQLSNLKADTNQKNANADNLQEQAYGKRIDNFVNDLMSGYSGMGLGKWKDGRKVGELTQQQAMSGWLKGEVRLPPRIENQFIDLLNNRTKKLGIEADVSMKQVEANLKRIGVTFQSDLTLRVATIMAMEEGIDTSTIQGGLLIYDNAMKLLPILSRGVLKGNTGKNPQMGQTRQDYTRTVRQNKYDNQGKRAGSTVTREHFTPRN